MKDQPITPLKGLEIARQFFFEWGFSLIQHHFPEYANRIAAGRLLGSDLLGGDDEISRDHNWGPQFFLFLTNEDYNAIGTQLSDTLNAAVPVPWNGYQLARPQDKNVLVVAIPHFFEKMLELSHCPQSPTDWSLNLTRYESELYFIRHGAIFHDPLGELTLWRNALRKYPAHLRFQRLDEECNRLWHRGEYNFVQRLINRPDPLTHAICLGEFIDATMRLYLLADGDFTPYWKWLPQEFRKSPHAPEIEPLLTQLALSQNTPEQRQLVTQICAHAYQHLLTLGFITGKDARPDQLPLLNARHELRQQSKIIV